ncbi:DMT family transporter [Shimia sp. W99]
MTQSPDITPQSWLMVAALGVIWGGTFMVQKLALGYLPPLWVAAGRISFAAVLTVALWQALGGRLFTSEETDWRALGLVSLLSVAIPFMLLSFAQQFVTSGFAGVSMAAVALITLPLAHVFIPGERMTLRRTIGFVIGFIGVLVLIGPGAFQSSGNALETVGRFACLGAACCYSVSSIVMRRLPPIDAVGLSAITLVFGMGLVVPMALINHGLPEIPAAQGLFYVVLLGLVPTAGANLLRNVVIRSAGPVFMSLTNYMVPLWSVLLGAVFLAEPVQPSLLWATLLILAGVGLSQYGALKRLFGAG